MSDFARLWTGYTIAQVGSQITVLALPLTAVLLLGAGATETGLLVALRMAPFVIVGPLLGVWVDRHPRRPILIGADVASTAIIASIPLAAAAGVLGLAQLYVVALLAGFLGITRELARGAFVPALVGRTQLARANARLQMSDAVAQVAGPSLGGALVQALSAPIAIAFDAASFVVSAAFVTAIRAGESPHPRETGLGLWHEVTAGLRWIRQHEVLFRSVVAIALANIEWFAVQAVLIVYGTKELALPPAFLGAALAASGPLSLLGAALVGPLIARLGLGPVMIAALLLEAISRLLLPFAAGPPIAAAAVLALTQALVGLTVPLWSVASRTLQQSVTPDRLLGRVGSASGFVQFVVAPPAALGAGVLADTIGLRPMLFIQGLIAVAAVIYLVASPVRTYRAPPG